LSFVEISLESNLSLFVLISITQYLNSYYDVCCLYFDASIVNVVIYI